MTFLAPGFLIAAAVAALAVVGLHFLSTRDAKPVAFPTARFVPDTATRATATTLRLTDLWLLLLRVLLVLLLGAALARPVLTPPRRPIARILAVDVSRAVGRPSELAQQVSNRLAESDVVILYDSTARIPQRGAADSLRKLAGKRLSNAPRGSLSAALVAALREASRLRANADSLELIVASPFLAEEADAATLRLRKLWPGRITTIRLPAAGAAEQQQDSADVVWADSATTDYFVAKPKADTIAGIRAGDEVLVYPFVRGWQAVMPIRAGGRVYARWADGQPAALEITKEHRCSRIIGFALPAEGDALLRPDFQRFVANLAQPCGGARDDRLLSASILAAIRGSGPLAPADEIAPRIEAATPLMPWLIVIVALLGLIEWRARDRRARDSA